MLFSCPAAELSENLKILRMSWFRLHDPVRGLQSARQVDEVRGGKVA